MKPVFKKEFREKLVALPHARWATTPEMTDRDLKTLLWAVGEYGGRATGEGAAIRQLKAGIDRVLRFCRGWRLTAEDTPWYIEKVCQDDSPGCPRGSVFFPNGIPTPRAWVSWFESQGLDVVWVDWEGRLRDTDDVPEQKYSFWRLRRRDGCSDIGSVFDEKSGPWVEFGCSCPEYLSVRGGEDPPAELTAAAYRYLTVFPDPAHRPFFSNRFRNELNRGKYTNWAVFPDLTEDEMIRLLTAVGEYARLTGSIDAAPDALRSLKAISEVYERGCVLDMPGPFGASELQAECMNEELPTPQRWLDWCRSRGLDAVWVSADGKAATPEQVPPQEYEGWYLQLRGASRPHPSGLLFTTCARYALLWRLGIQNVDPCAEALWVAAGRQLATLSTVSVTCGGIRLSGRDWGACVEYRARQ